MGPHENENGVAVVVEHLADPLAHFDPLWRIEVAEVLLAVRSHVQAVIGEGEHDMFRCNPLRSKQRCIGVQLLDRGKLATASWGMPMALRIGEQQKEMT